MMKKLIIILLLIAANLPAIAQHLVREESNLCYTHGTEKEVIAESTLLNLLGENNYNNYNTSKKYYNLGNSLKTSGWIALAGGAVLTLIGSKLYIENTPNNHNYSSHYNQDLAVFGYLLQVTGLAAFGSGCVLVPTGYILRGVNAGKINRIADDYNKNNMAFGVSFSYTF